jgi:YD repeat-containing protein
MEYWEPRMKPKPATALATGLLVVACCRTSHIEGTKVCRRYATTFSEAGQPYQCTFDVRFLRCTGSASTVWEYSGPSEFVLEAQVPNRILALTRSVSTGGPMLISASTTRADYRYDGSGRLLERRRWRNNVTGLRELDVVEYTAWDAFGRPTSGTIRAGDRSGAVTLQYDDAARRMEASNREAVIRDADGNIVREVVVIGFGEPSVVDTLIQGTTEFCL